MITDKDTRGVEGEVRIVGSTNDRFCDRELSPALQSDLDGFNFEVFRALKGSTQFERADTSSEIRATHLRKKIEVKSADVEEMRAVITKLKNGDTMKNANISLWVAAQKIVSALMSNLFGDADSKDPAQVLWKSRMDDALRSAADIFSNPSQITDERAAMMAIQLLKIVVPAKPVPKTEQDFPHVENSNLRFVTTSSANKSELHKYEQAMLKVSEDSKLLKRLLKSFLGVNNVNSNDLLKLHQAVMMAGQQKQLTHLLDFCDQTKLLVDTPDYTFSNQVRALFAAIGEWDGRISQLEKDIRSHTAELYIIEQ